MSKMINNIVKLLIPRAYFPFTMFPYPYRGEPYAVQSGEDNGLPFCEYAGKRVYFPSGMTREQVEWCFRVYLEDEGLTGLGRRTRSPHCYVTENHRPDENDVIVDIGASEGFFTRGFIEEARRAVLIETEDKWQGPESLTFKAFPDKVEIIAQCLERIDIPKKSDDESFFIKMDIEGAEVGVLESSKDFLTSNRCKISCCVYHRRTDAKVIERILRAYGYSTEFSRGVMIPYGAKWPRKGVIYGRNY